MSFGIATTAIIPVRVEPRHQSEMKSQILFGEMMNVLQTETLWSKIKLDFDGTEGWIDNEMFQIINAIQYNTIKQAKTIILDTISEILIGNESHPMRVMPGSELHINGPQSNQMDIGNQLFSLKYRTSIPIKKNTRHSVISKAMEYLNAPYLWGGRSLYGIDCSAFTQIVYKQNNIILPREVENQFSIGKIINDMEQSMPGDLAFMANNEGKICHVGIVIEPFKIIHADSFVRFAFIDNNTVYNIENQTNTYKLKYIRNVID